MDLSSDEAKILKFVNQRELAIISAKSQSAVKVKNTGVERSIEQGLFCILWIAKTVVDIIYNILFDQGDYKLAIDLLEITIRNYVLQESPADFAYFIEDFFKCFAFLCMVLFCFV